MKYNKAGNCYIASNVVYNANDEKAYSYSWWRFVERINGALVFNCYNFSNTTCKHQNKVSRLLQTLGINIDLTIACPKGLQDLESGIAYYNTLIDKYQAEINNPKSKAAKNKQRLDSIGDCKGKIETIKGLIESKRKVA